MCVRVWHMCVIYVCELCVSVRVCVSVYVCVNLCVCVFVFVWHMRKCLRVYVTDVSVCQCEYVCLCALVCILYICAYVFD